MKKLIALLCLALASWHSFAETTATTLAFGVLNQQSPAKTAERWNPILRYLTEKTGLHFQLRMGATVQDTDTMMGRGEFDLVFSNHNFQPRYDGVYRVLARFYGPPIYGVIAVPKDSAVRSLHDLAGEKVAFPSKDAFVAYAVPMAALKDAQVSVAPVMAGTQEGALTQLALKQVAAAAVNSRFLTRYAAVRNFQYREVLVSEGYADLPVSVHSRVPREQVEAIRKALLAMRSDPAAASILEAADCPGFVAATERDYDSQRRAYRKGS